MQAGYKVRGYVKIWKLTSIDTHCPIVTSRTARGTRINSLRESLLDAYPALELVQVDDIVTADLTDALTGSFL
jgi:hypothetical protein